MDDDVDVTRGVSLRMRAAGIDSLVAHDGEEGIRLAQDRQPASIVLDVRMPGTSGLQVLRELQGNPLTRDIPVVMLSASLVDQQKALDSGARFFIAKPFESTSLVKAVKLALAEKSHACTVG